MHLCKHTKIQLTSNQVINSTMYENAVSTATTKCQTKKFEIMLSSTKNVTLTS